MIKVRDLTNPISDYKGHLCWAVDKNCPCKPCFCPHDCHPPNPAYSKKKYSEVFDCVTNWNRGCPSPHPEPEHIYIGSSRRCVRCGEYMHKGNGNVSNTA